MSNNKQQPNNLINESSPYLLQHAYNPVNWLPWGEEAFNKAKTENKLILVSIGYSACHWCHVMEHESFEDEAVAQLMNEHFVCIKVDREERPDIDQVYMTAVQLMNQQGGWPLNCFTTPDTKPFYGGTYFPKETWKNVLYQLKHEYKNNPDKVIEYANRLAEGLQQTELIKLNTSAPSFNMEVLDVMVQRWKQRFDIIEGGANRAPKFPLPNNYQFLLRYYHHTKDNEVLQHVKLTLNKMALGGIYDQIGGGFARYSVDSLWKVPHFEKMLYDNAQLVSLYSEAYQLTKNELYKEVVYDSINFVQNELTDETGAFYSALDADSEGEEGKYYVWKEKELKSILNQDLDLFKEYYNINEKGYWEHDNYILLRTSDDIAFAQKHNIEVDILKQKIQQWKSLLLFERSKRTRPGLDDKSLTSWNALMIKGLIDAYNVFNERSFLELALKNINFIIKHQLSEDGKLFHSYKKGRSTINGFLEDYCFTLEALIALYETTFDEQWIQYADKIATHSIEHFLDKESNMFFFTSDLDEKLIARKIEVNDNVIPASNSSMAKGLFLLGHLLDKNEYVSLSETMLNNIQSQMSGYGSAYSNWGQLMLYFTNPFHEIAICGKDCQKKKQELNQHYIPNKLILGSNKNSDLPLLKNKFTEEQTSIYVCVNKACQLPVTETKEAIKQIK